MDCPRCDGPITVYALGGTQAVGCEACGYVGIDADHRGGSEASESWSEAFRRFYGRE